MKTKNTNLLRRNSPGFTIVELLVVVAIIVILISILIPALDKAKAAAMQGVEMANFRTITQNSQQYALANGGYFPHYKNGNETESYDLRTNAAEPKPAGGLGYLVTSKYLPTGAALGKMMHCLVLDNTGGSLPGHNMDVASGYGFGASFWDTQPGKRMFSGYSYRAASYTKNKGSFKSSRVGSREVFLTDLLDMRVRGAGNKYSHTDGFNRSFIDGSTAFRKDPQTKVDQALIMLNGSVDNAEGRADGLNKNGLPDERGFEELARE